MTASHGHTKLYKVTSVGLLKCDRILDTHSVGCSYYIVSSCMVVKVHDVKGAVLRSA